MTVIDRRAVSVSSEERAAVESIAALLVAPDVVEIETPRGRARLPESLRAVLTYATEELLSGSRVSVVPVDDELTTQQAADLLAVSRPFLVQLLERDELPYRMVGTHRRIRADDVLRYREDRTIRRRHLLRRMAREAQEQGVYT